MTNEEFLKKNNQDANKAFTKFKEINKKLDEKLNEILSVL